MLRKHNKEVPERAQDRLDFLATACENFKRLKERFEVWVRFDWVELADWKHQNMSATDVALYCHSAIVGEERE